MRRCFSNIFRLITDKPHAFQKQSIEKQLMVLKFDELLRLINQESKSSYSSSGNNCLSLAFWKDLRGVKATRNIKANEIIMRINPNLLINFRKNNATGVYTKYFTQIANHSSDKEMILKFIQRFQFQFYLMEQRVRFLNHSKKNHIETNNTSRILQLYFELLPQSYNDLPIKNIGQLRKISNDTFIQTLEKAQTQMKQIYTAFKEGIDRKNVVPSFQKLYSSIPQMDALNYELVEWAFLMKGNRQFGQTDISQYFVPIVDMCNHSSSASNVLQSVETFTNFHRLVATRDIQKDQQVTLNYDHVYSNYSLFKIYGFCDPTNKIITNDYVLFESINPKLIKFIVSSEKQPQTTIQIKYNFHFFISPSKLQVQSQIIQTFKVILEKLVEEKYIINLSLNAKSLAILLIEQIRKIHQSYTLSQNQKLKNIDEIIANKNNSSAILINLAQNMKILCEGIVTAINQKNMVMKEIQQQLESSEHFVQQIKSVLIDFSKRHPTKKQ